MDLQYEKFSGVVTVATADLTTESLLAAQKEIAETLATRGVLPQVIGATATVLSAEVSTTHTAESVATHEVELSPELTARLEALNPEYKKAVLAAYNHRRGFTDRYITEGKLPEAYCMPTLDYFIDMIEAGAATHAIFEQKGWQPHVGFVPKELRDNQWSGLFDSYSKTGKGTRTTFDQNMMFDPSGTISSSERWGYAITSAADRPVLLNVAKEDTHDTKVTLLRILPNIPEDATPDQVIALASPAEATYRELQLTRVERDQTPVDGSTWSLLKENATFNGSLRAVTACFRPEYSRVESVTALLDDSDVRCGVRPSSEWQKS